MRGALGARQELVARGGGWCTAAVWWRSHLGAHWSTVKELRWPARHNLLQVVRALEAGGAGGAWAAHRRSSLRWLQRCARGLCLRLQDALKLSQHYKLLDWDDCLEWADSSVQTRLRDSPKAV